MPEPIIVHGPSRNTVVKLSTTETCSALPDVPDRVVSLIPKDPKDRFTKIVVKIKGVPQAAIEIAADDEDWSVTIS